jgi:uncharacterized protein (AIM24 family)
MSRDRATENQTDPFAATVLKSADDTRFFELDGDSRLKIHLNGGIWIKTGTVLLSDGRFEFRQEKWRDTGLLRYFKRIACRAPAMMRAEGSGQLCLADSPKKIVVVRLSGETLWVGGSDILAMEMTLERDFALLRRIAGLGSPGCLWVRLRGSGLAAISTRYELIRLKGSLRSRTAARRDATSWPGGLKPEFKVGVSHRGAGTTAAQQLSRCVVDHNLPRAVIPADSACTANS